MEHDFDVCKNWVDPEIYNNMNNDVVVVCVFNSDSECEQWEEHHFPLPILKNLYPLTEQSVETELFADAYNCSTWVHESTNTDENFESITETILEWLPMTTVELTNYLNSIVEEINNA